MQLKITPFKSALLVQIAGEIDLQETDHLRRKVDAYLDHYGVAHLVFDFTQVNFIDSSGVGVILGRYRKMQERGGKVSIVGAAPVVEKVLVFSGVPKIMTLYANLQEVEDL